MDKRPRYIDTVFTVFLLFYMVFFLTLLPKTVTGVARTIGCSLLLPGFFLAEGALCSLEQRQKQSESGYLKDCFRRFLLPYFLFSALGLLLRLIGFWCGIGSVSSVQLKSQLLDTLSFNGYGMLWIFPVLFLAVLSYGYLRSSLPYAACLGISIALLLLSYFAKGIWVISETSDFGVKQYVMKLAMTLWRACEFMVFVSLGEGLELFLRRKDKYKVVLGIAGLCLTVAGFLMTYWNTESIDFRYFQFGEPALILPELLLINSGIFLFARWIGQLGAAELAGRNWCMFFLTVDTFYLLSAVDVIGAQVLESSQNNFLTAAARILCLLIFEAVFMLGRELAADRICLKRKSGEEGK